jgi:hypothetical protein
MSAVNSLVKHYTALLMIFVVLPPGIIIASLLAIYLLLNISGAITAIIIAVPIALVFAITKALLWWRIFISPLKRVSKAIRSLKASGYVIDESTIEVVDLPKSVARVRSCSEIPREGVYKVAAVAVGRGARVVGIANESGAVYDLTSIESC